MLKVALVGVGGISGAHIPAWREMEGVELVALCDIRPEQMKKYQDIRQYTDLSTMLQEEKPDILDICVPTFLHADFAVQAMQQGIHVLCEKPISLKAEDVRRVYDTAAQNGVCFMVAQVLRFWREYEFVKEVYDSGRYGRLLSGTMTRLGSIPGWSWDNWMRDESRSGLVPYDVHIHDLDFMVYAFGKPQGVTSRRVKRPEQDFFRVIYDFDGFSIEAEASWYAAPYPFGARFRFQFEQAVIENGADGLKVYEVGGKIYSLDEATSGDMGEINLPKSDAYANEIRYFSDCVKHHRPADRVKAEELETVIHLLNRL